MVKNVQYAQPYLHYSYKEATTNASHARGSHREDTAAWKRQYFRLGYKVQIKDNLTTCASAKGLLQPPTAEYLIPGFSLGAPLLGLQGLLSFREAPRLLGGTVGEDSCCSSSSPAWQRVYAGRRGVWTPGPCGVCMCIPAGAFRAAWSLAASRTGILTLLGYQGGLKLPLALGYL